MQLPVAIGTGSWRSHAVAARQCMMCWWTHLRFGVPCHVVFRSHDMGCSVIYMDCRRLSCSCSRASPLVNVTFNEVCFSVSRPGGCSLVLIGVLADVSLTKSVASWPWSTAVGACGLDVRYSVSGRSPYKWRCNVRSAWAARLLWICQGMTTCSVLWWCGDAVFCATRCDMYYIFLI